MTIEPMNSHDDKHPEANPSHTLRAGDTGVGIPPSVGLEGARLVTDDERVQQDRQEEDEQRERFRERLLELDAARGYVLPRFVQRTAFWLGLLVASLLGLLIVTQIASLIADIGTMPGPWAWALGATGALCGAIVLWVTLKFAWTLLRLQRNPAVNRAAIEALSERELWQRLALEEFESAEEHLRGYLAGYELDSKSATVLMASGLSTAELDDLIAAKRYLLSDDAYLPSRDWIVEFQRRFQSVLDLSASRRAKSYARRAALGTALVPVAIIDQAVVFYFCLKLVRELMVFYNVRPAFGQTATIIARAIIQTYLAGQIQQLTEDGTEALSDAAIGSVDELATSSFASIAGAKLAEGALNGMMIWRLGNRAMSLLQPVKRSD